MEITEINTKLDSEKTKIDIPSKYGRTNYNLAKNIALSAGVCLFANNVVANPTIYDVEPTIETLNQYESNINRLNYSTVTTEYEARELVALTSTNNEQWFDNSVDLLATANEFLKGTKPLEGEMLKHLSDYFDKSAKRKPTLPNRL